MKTGSVSTLLFAAMAVAFLPQVGAEEYPTRPVRLIVGFPPGGATDLVARIIQPRMTELLGRQLVVHNRPGANGIISLELVAKAEPDGYTLAIGHIGGLVISPAIQKVPYDPVKSFASVGLMVTLQNIIIVHPSVAAKSGADFLALAKAQAGKLNYATSGVGSPGHLAAELLESMTGVRMSHVPYKGGGPAISDLIAGHIPAFFAVISTAVPHVQSGRARPIAVTGIKRAGALPDVPTLGETVRGYSASNWYGVLAPAKTPQPVIDRINKALIAALQTPDVVKQLNARGIDATPNTPAEYAAFIREEDRKWLPIITQAKIQP